MTKKEFISNYMTRNMRKFRWMDFGVKWLNQYAETEERAEKAWKKFKNKPTKP